MKFSLTDVFGPTVRPTLNMLTSSPNFATVEQKHLSRNDPVNGVHLFPPYRMGPSNCFNTWNYSANNYTLYLLLQAQHHFIHIALIMDAIKRER